MPSLRIGLLSLTLCITISASFAQITSSFNTDAEGWTAIDHQGGPTPTYVAAGGNPGGFIQVVDGVLGTATYFVAPAKFLGNRSSSFGQLLQFDLQVSVLANSSTAGVRLTGGGITLVKLLPALPVVEPNWSSYAFRLDESADWLVSTTGLLATNVQIQTVLASLTELAINGEYSTTAADGGGLDNVVLETGVENEIVIYNAVAPNGNEANRILLLEFIDTNSQTQRNTVTIFNRWGDEVFRIEDYNNTTRVFNGLSSDGKELPTGTYFYKVEFESGKEAITGYLSLKR